VLDVRLHFVTRRVGSRPLLDVIIQRVPLAPHLRFVDGPSASRYRLVQARFLQVETRHALVSTLSPQKSTVGVQPDHYGPHGPITSRGG